MIALHWERKKRLKKMQDAANRIKLGLAVAKRLSVAAQATSCAAVQKTDVSAEPVTTHVEMEPAEALERV